MERLWRLSHLASSVHWSSYHLERRQMHWITQKAWMVPWKEKDKQEQNQQKTKPDKPKRHRSIQERWLGVKQLPPLIPSDGLLPDAANNFLPQTHTKPVEFPSAHHGHPVEASSDNPIDRIWCARWPPHADSFISILFQTWIWSQSNLSICGFSPKQRGSPISRERGLVILPNLHLRGSSMFPLPMCWSLHNNTNRAWSSSQRSPVGCCTHIFVPVSSLECFRSICLEPVWSWSSLVCTDASVFFPDNEAMHWLLAYYAFWQLDIIGIARYGHCHH